MDKLKNWLCGLEYEICQGSCLEEIEDVVSDSRKARPGTVFVCLRGSRTDSHRFIGEVVEKGCTSVIIEKAPEELPCKVPPHVNLIRVSDSRKALAVLCSARFGRPSGKLCMIGITGTKGKTSTSYMLRTILGECGIKAGVMGTNGCFTGGRHIKTLNTTPGSYELHSLLKMMADEGCKAAIMECSSQGFKQWRTYGINFDYGIFLNLSHDHIGPLEHGSFEEYLACKSVLFTQCRTAIANADDAHVFDVLDKAGGGYSKLVTFSCGNEGASLYASDINYISDSSFSGTAFNTGGLCRGTYRLSIPGKFNVSNCLAAMACALDLGLPGENIGRALEKVHVEGRMEAVYKSDKFTCIVDYAHNETSMVSLLETLRSYKPGRLVIVFGCGGNRSRERRTGMARAAAMYADFSIITSDNSRYENPDDIMADIEEAYLGTGRNPESCIKIRDRAMAIRYAMEHAENGDMVAVIGKGHEDYQEENGVRRHFLDKEEILKAKEELGL